MRKHPAFLYVLLMLIPVLAGCSRTAVEQSPPTMVPQHEQSIAAGDRQVANNENIVVSPPPIAPPPKIVPRPRPKEVPLPVTPKPAPDVPTTPAKAAATVEEPSAIAEVPALAVQQTAEPSVPAIPDKVPAPATPAATTRFVTIPAGTMISVRTIESIDSRTDHVGQTYRASIDDPVTVNNEAVIPRGADARLALNRVTSAGDFRGKSELEIELDRIVVAKKEYAVSSNVIERSGEAEGPKTAAEVGVGAAIGAAIGGIAGGGKGAAIGAGVGAGSGAVVAAATRGEQVVVPSEARLEFRLEQPFDVEVSEPPPTAAPKDRLPATGPRRLGESSTKPDKGDYNAWDFSGEWKLVVEDPRERRTLKLFLEQDGNMLMGRIVDPFRGELRLRGSINGRALRFSTETDIPGATARSEYKGTLSGNRLRGTVVTRVTEWASVPNRGRGRPAAKEEVFAWSAQRVKR